MTSSVDRCASLVAVVVLALGSACTEAVPVGENVERVPTLVLEHLLTVDGDDVLFSGIRSIVADEAGRIYVANDQNQMLHEILVIDADGRQVRTIGRRGEGPGEFGNISGLVWVGGQLLASDVRLQRFSFFDPLGGFVRMWSWDRVFQNGGAPPLMSNGTTGFALVNGLSVDPGICQMVVDSTYLLFRSDGSVEMLQRISEPRDSIPQTLVCVLPDGMSFQGGPLPFFDRGPRHAFLPNDRVALAQRDAFRIDIFDLRTQELVQSLSGPVAPIPLSSNAWEEQPEIEFFRKLAGEFGDELIDRDRGGNCTPDRLRPEFYPVVRTIFSDEEGRIWVETTGEDGTGFDLFMFDSSGELTGRAVMPDRDPSVLPHVCDDRLYLVSRDSLGVQSVEVFTFRTS